MTPSTAVESQAALAFNQLAEQYDELFTKSSIGRAQRDAVWNVMTKTFNSGDHLLELNCGTGEDALFLARHGISVVACDASGQMIRVANERLLTEAPDAPVKFIQQSTEHIRDISSAKPFNGIFSNFSGLNCVADLRRTAKDLAGLVPPGAPFVVCLSTRFCVSEMIWFLLQGKPRKAFRRSSGRATAKVGEFVVEVYYPTLRQLRSSFSPAFALVSCTGIGIAVPPSYVEPWIRRFPKLLRTLTAIDRVLASLPWFRVLGDHMLLRFERVHA